MKTLRHVAIALTLFSTLLTASGDCGTLFADSFDLGPDASWLQTSRWSGANGRLYYTGPSDNLRFLCGGSLGCQLYTMSFDFCRSNASDELGFMTMSPLAPTPGVQPSGYVVFLSNDGYGYLSANGDILVESNNPLLLMEVGIRYRVEFGYGQDKIRYRHWPIGSPPSDWFWALNYDGQFDSGYWYIFVNSSATGSWIDNFIVEGQGTVTSKTVTWSEIKTMFD